MLKFYDKQHDIKLSFDIVGYQFPEITQGSDADWCNVALHLQQGEKSFNVIDPAIEAKDLPRLLQWFTDLSERKLPDASGIGFLEPCFSFEFKWCTEKFVRIDAVLKAEMRPNFYINQGFLSPADEEDEYNIWFNLTDKDFADNIQSLKNIMQQYPIRCSHY